jgi:hypothetical protein
VGPSENVAKEGARRDRIIRIDERMKAVDHASDGSPVQPPLGIATP